MFLTNSLHALSLAEAIGKAKTNPVAIERGEQIADEFYDYAKQWLT